MQRTPELNDAIQNLYRVFESYPLNKPFLGCPCCHEEGHNLILESKPMRALTWDDLREYANDAILTWGLEEDFKHFLPRIFELLPESLSLESYSDAEIILRKLHHANWEQWPVAERDSARDYLHALWRAAIDTDYDDEGYLDENIDRWLCGIAQAENDMTPYLADWIANSSSDALRNLVYFILNEVDFTRRQVGNAFMDDRKLQSQQIFAWITSPAVLDTLRTVPEEDDEAQGKLEMAISVLA